MPSRLLLAVLPSLAACTTTADLTCPPTDAPVATTDAGPGGLTADDLLDEVEGTHSFAATDDGPLADAGPYTVTATDADHAFVRSWGNCGPDDVLFVAVDVRVRSPDDAVDVSGEALVSADADGDLRWDHAPTEALTGALPGWAHDALDDLDSRSCETPGEPDALVSLFGPFDSPDLSVQGSRRVAGECSYRGEVASTALLRE